MRRHKSVSSQKVSQLVGFCTTKYDSVLIFMIDFYYLDMYKSFAVWYVAKSAGNTEYSVTVPGPLGDVTRTPAGFGFIYLPFGAFCSFAVFNLHSPPALPIQSSHQGDPFARRILRQQ